MILLLTALLGERRTARAEDVATFRGVGPVRVGMGVEELRKAVGEEVEVEPRALSGCGYAKLPGRFSGVWAMVVKGSVARVDVTREGIRTSSGVAVGSTEGAAREAYGKRVVVTHHEYVEEGHYLTVSDSGGRHALVLETEGGVVTSFRVGRLPEVTFPEGCE